MRPRYVVKKHRSFLLVFAAVIGLSTLVSTPPTASATGLSVPDTDPCLPDADPPCVLLAKGCTEHYVPLEGTQMSECVPPGSYISGYLRIKTSMVSTTCGMRMRTETSTCGAKIVVPGVGVFTSSETIIEESKIDFVGMETELNTYGNFKYRLGGCGGETFRLSYKVRIKIDPLGRQSVSRETYCDCYVPCCGTAVAGSHDD